MQRVLVTGGTGFIGRYVVQALRASGYVVRVLYRHQGKITSLPAEVECCFGDMSTGEGLESAVQGVDIVVHLAGTGFGPKLSVEAPLETARVNLFGTVTLLECCRIAGVRRFVFASTGQVYGDADAPYTPQSPVHPLTPYGLQKYQAELAVRQYAELYGMQTLSLRLFNVYGAGMREVDGWKPVVQIFFERARQGLPIPIEGQGSQRRDFIHVLDVADAFVRSCQVSKAFCGEVLNVAAGKTYSMRELAQYFGVPIEFVPSRDGEPGVDPVASITETSIHLGWHPSIELADGICWLVENNA